MPDCPVYGFDLVSKISSTASVTNCKIQVLVCHLGHGGNGRPM